MKTKSDLIPVMITRKEFLGLPRKSQRVNMKWMVATSSCREALDALARALATHDHVWTDNERDLYERATGVTLP